MLRGLTSIFSAPAYQQESHTLYLRVVEQSRKPVFYTNYAVPDTLDGRFDTITLHMFLLVDRLKKIGTPDALALLRAVSEIFFADMDRSLREMGSTDTGVGKRIKKMSQAFYGRLLAYQTAGNDMAKMQESILRNLYRGDITKQFQSAKMAEYVQQQLAAYTKLTFDDVVSAVLPN